MIRIFDILVSSIAIALSSPLLALIAVAIRIETPGRVIFRQRRAGKCGKPFVMLKFRTMRADVDPYAASPHGPEDARLTRIGRFLRERSLDELPQLFNVLLGHMSLVGPRPLYERQADKWDARQRRRLDVRPGLTGYSQAYGRAGLTHEEKIEMDLEYVERQSFTLNVRIVLKTVANLFARRGIYEKRYSRDKERETD